MTGIVAERDPALQTRIVRTGWIFLAIAAALFVSSLALILSRWWVR